MWLFSVGEARDAGAELKVAPLFRIAIAETLQIHGGKPPSFVVHYTYAFYDAGTGERLFRFEYHPFLPPQKRRKSNQWSLIHHLHVDDNPHKLSRIHFPIAPFLTDPDERPDQVLATVLRWCADDLAS
jgi:hypothetical protein